MIVGRTRPATLLLGAALALCSLTGCAGTRCPARACPPRCDPVAIIERPTQSEPKEAQRPPFAAEGETSVWGYLQGKYDVDGDGALSLEEHGRGAEAFLRLDRDQDGAITEQDFRRGGRMQTMIAQMAVMRTFQADEDARELERSELETSFAKHDADADGRLELDEFTAVLEASTARLPRGVDPFEAMLRVADEDDDGALSAAELGAFFEARDGDGDGLWKMPARRGRGERAASGVAHGADAPDFTLRPPGGGEAVTLSAFRGEKPVALIFGSYT